MIWAVPRYIARENIYVFVELKTFLQQMISKANVFSQPNKGCEVRVQGFREYVLDSHKREN